jgi:hypothetical protein
MLISAERKGVSRVGAMVMVLVQLTTSSLLVVVSDLGVRMELPTSSATC